MFTWNNNTHGVNNQGVFTDDYVEDSDEASDHFVSKEAAVINADPAGPRCCCTTQCPSSMLQQSTQQWYAEPQADIHD